MSRSVRRRGRYGAAEKDAKIRAAGGGAAAAKAGRCAGQAQKSGDCAGDLSAFRQSAENRGNCARMFRQSADWGMLMPSEGRARGILGRNAPRGSSCLPCCCRRRQRAAFRGIFGLGDMTPRLSFSPRRRSALAAESRPRRGGVRSVRKERKLGVTRSAAPLEVWLRRGAGEFRGEVAPEHACRGQRIGALRESAAARRERGAFSAGRVSPEGGRPAEG